MMKIKKFPDGTIEVDLDINDDKEHDILKEILRDDKKKKDKKLLNETLNVCGCHYRNTVYNYENKIETTFKPIEIETTFPSLKHNI